MKVKAVAYKGGKCTECGYNKCLGAMEFHHLDEKTKSFELSNCHTRSWATVLKELDKCILLCSNCHKEVEWLKKADKYKYYEQIGQLQEIEAKNKKAKGPFFFECETCKKQFESPTSEKRRFCSDRCNKFSQRRVEWPEKEQLEKLVWEKPTTHIAKNYGVSENTVGDWCRLYNISKPPRGYWQKFDNALTWVI
jgi:endogenous inhibitor of DNA gyrase (YacG/DUF329 family)